MTSDDLGKQLHDRATRGQQLTTEEQNRLAEWYRRLDEEEARQFAAAQSASIPDEKTRDDVDKLLAQLAFSAQRMRVLAAENDQLRREIEELHRQLAQKRTAKSA